MQVRSILGPNGNGVAAVFSPITDDLDRFKPLPPAVMTMRQCQIQERIVQRVSQTEAGCWEWLGARSPETGYGNLTLKAEGIGSAHRASWYAYHGHPGKMYVLHKCDNRICCNPAHLFLGTAKDNSQDMVRKGRNRNPASQRQACPRGHSYDGININGARICKRCNVETVKRWRDKKRDLFI